MATARENNYDKIVVPGAQKSNAYLDTKSSHIPGKSATATWQTPVKRGGRNVSALQELADTKTLGQQNQEALAKIDAKVSSLVGAIAALNKGEPFDEAKLLAGIEEAAERGVLNAVDSVTRQEVTVVTLKDEEEPLAAEEVIPAEEPEA